MTGWLPGAPGQYHSSPIDGNAGYDEYDDDIDNEPSGTTETAPISASSHEAFTIDQTPAYNVPGSFDESDSSSQTTEEGSIGDVETAGDIETARDIETTRDIPIMENEGFEIQLQKFNPWRTLDKFRNPMKQEDISLYSRFPLLCLPAELLLIVAEHLPIESAACLALACRTTYLALGTRWFKMPKPNLWNFLLLIEHERLISYACPRCLKLHRPPNFFIQYNWCCSVPRVLSTNLPETISPGLVKMIGRKYFEDPRASQEYLSWLRMSAKKTTRHIKLATHVIPRMLDGSLLLRTETYMQPFRKGNLTERSLMEMIFHVFIRCVYYHRKIPQLCDHQDWNSHLPNLTAFKESIKATRCVGCVEMSSGTRHFARCYANQRMFSPARRGLRLPIMACVLIHKQPCNSCKQMSEDRYDGEIKGCKKCATDFCVSAREVPGVGTCVVLTSWKNIGGIGPGQADHWDRHVTHHRSPDDRIEDEFRSDRQVGQIYEAFEGLSGGKAGKAKHYRPQTDSKMVRDLTRRVHKFTSRYMADETTDTEADTESEEDYEDEASS